MPLRITLDSGSRLAGVPIAVEVIGSDFETKWKGAILIGETETIDGLAADRYSVRARLPSGQKITKVCKLGENETENINIKLSGSSCSDSLQWASLCKPDALAEAEQRESQLRSVWLRLWGCGGDGRWQVLPWPIQKAEREPGLVQYEFNLSDAGLGQYYLQVGGPTMQWRLIALPATQILVLITGAQRSDNQDKADSAVEVCVTSKEHKAEILLGYLSRGGIEAAKLVSPSIAADLLAGKRRNPTAAAVAGYYLLATSKLKSDHQLWTNNLADWMTWLPDGAVINAYYSMRADTPDLAHARRRLLEAAARGVPIYTYGLRLLLDGLALFAGDPENGGPDVSAAHKRVRNYAAAADWRALTTTFIGEDPSSPGVSKLGKPDEPRHVVFIADADEEDLAWKQRPSRRRSSPTRTKDIPATEPASDTGFHQEGNDSLIYKQESEQDYSAPQTFAESADYKAAESKPDPETARLAARGEAAEPAHDAPAREITGSPQVIHTLSPKVSRKYSRYRSLRAANAVPRPRSIETDERTIARLFRAANLQTQAEQMSDAVKPLSGDQRAAKLHGLSLHGLAVERIIGTSDLLSVSFLNRGLAAARTVGRVVMGATADPRTYATGFLVSPRLFITNNHVIQNAEQAWDGLVEFDYQDGPDGRLLSPTHIGFDPDTFFLTSRELDFTLVALDDAEASREFGWNHLNAEQGKILLGEYFSIVQHAGGAPKQVSLRENQLVGIEGDFLHYQNETAIISSGAPLFNDQWEVVGMHQSGIPAHADAIIAHVGVRVSCMVNFLRSQVLPPQAAVLRDEVLFLKPPN